FPEAPHRLPGTRRQAGADSLFRHQPHGDCPRAAPRPAISCSPRSRLQGKRRGDETSRGDPAGSAAGREGRKGGRRDQPASCLTRPSLIPGVRQAVIGRSSRNTMQLSIRDLTNLLNVAEGTVSRWIKQRGLPAQRVGGQYRVNRAELLEWATANQVRV